MGWIPPEPPPPSPRMSGHPPYPMPGGRGPRRPVECVGCGAPLQLEQVQCNFCRRLTGARPERIDVTTIDDPAPRTLPVDFGMAMNPVRPRQPEPYAAQSMSDGVWLVLKLMVVLVTLGFFCLPTLVRML